MFPAASDSGSSAPSNDQPRDANNEGNMGGRSGVGGGQNMAYSTNGQARRKTATVAASPPFVHVDTRQYPTSTPNNQGNLPSNTPLSIDVGYQREREIEKIRGIERERRVTVTSAMDDLSIEHDVSSTSTIQQQQQQQQQQLQNNNLGHNDSKEYRRQLERELERQTDARMARNVFKGYKVFDH